MLCIGIPILASIRLPMQQKAILLLIFGMGIFVIAASILTKVYCLVPSLISYVYMNWYYREASVGMYVTNLPAIWPLMRDMFPLLKTWGSAKTTRRTGTADKRYTLGTSRKHITSKDGHQLTSFDAPPFEVHRAESQVHIRSGSDSSSSLAKSLDNNTILEIHKDVTVTIESYDIEAAKRESDARYGWERGDNTKNETVVESAPSA